MPINNQISVSTFQNVDGSNFTTAGAETSISSDKGSLSFYGGLGTNFTKGSTGVVFDFKGNVNYGNSHVSGGARIRNIINKDNPAVYARVYPANVNIPLNKNAKAYLQSYVQTKISYKTGDTKTTFGTIAGLELKVGNTTVIPEMQLCDFTKINKSTVSGNAIVKIPFKAP